MTNSIVRKLPIGIQTFEKIREGNYVYVDKTEWVWRMASLETPFFLSRPRRFGKSLLLSRVVRHHPPEAIGQGCQQRPGEIDRIGHRRQLDADKKPRAKGRAC